MFPLDELGSPEVSFSLRLTLRTCAACLVLHAVAAGEYRRAAALCLLLGLVSLLLYVAVELCQKKRK